MIGDYHIIITHKSEKFPFIVDFVIKTIEYFRIIPIYI